MNLTQAQRVALVLGGEGTYPHVEATNAESFPGADLDGVFLLAFDSRQARLLESAAEARGTDVETVLREIVERVLAEIERA